jgi:hypothetical protein
VEGAADSTTCMPEPPEDFVDPITASIIHNPVTLPDSQVTLDRTTVERHLLSQVRTAVRCVHVCGCVCVCEGGWVGLGLSCGLNR